MCFAICSYFVLFLFFFLQAEDGIRDYKVTGVQTCALPISDEVKASLIPMSPKVHFLGHDSTEGHILGQVAGPPADAQRLFSSCSPAASRRMMLVRPLRPAMPGRRSARRLFATAAHRLPPA